MKNLFRTLMLAVCFLTTVGLAGATSYPSTLGQNSHIQFMYAHMQTGFYLDTSSVQVKHVDEHSLLYSVNTWAGFFDENNQLRGMQGPTPVWFYYTDDERQTFTIGLNVDGRLFILPPYVGKNIAYVSITNGQHWMPFYIHCDLGVCKSSVATFHDSLLHMPKSVRAAAWYPALIQQP